MHSKITWRGKSEPMRFTEGEGESYVSMDSPAPLGKGMGRSPKQLMLSSICGCTAMDVIALLKKYKQDVASFTCEAEADLTDTHPKMFKQVNVTYHLEGSLDLEKVKEAARLSMTQYCGVTAMVAKAAPVRYTIYVNGEVIERDAVAFNS
ncbi:MAG TPA: OsmC family protein [Pseudobdellovibrionaceae bacterium]|nr:OsmC family protein [Pseudobdellovibrionaceae bacterium]